jgi:hypothetical protein
MSNTQHSRVRDGDWLLLAVGVLAALLVSCSRANSVEVRSAAPPAPVTAPPGDIEAFQGSVASIDMATAELQVAVQIVWAPVLRAERSQRLVVAGPQTRWEPLGNGIAGLHVGDEVQVEATSGADGRWHAVTISLFDID